MKDNVREDIDLLTKLLHPIHESQDGDCPHIEW